MIFMCKVTKVNCDHDNDSSFQGSQHQASTGRISGFSSLGDVRALSIKWPIDS